MWIAYIFVLFQFWLLILIIKKYFQEIMIQNHEFPTIVLAFFYITAISLMLWDEEEFKGIQSNITESNDTAVILLEEL